MTFIQNYLPEFDAEMANTRKILERVPEDKFTWKPHEKSMTLGRLASHIAELANWATTTVATETLEIQPDFKPFNAPTSAELLAGFDKYAKEAHAALERVSDETLAVEWSLIFGGKKVMSMPRSQVLRSIVLNHLIHHRGQLGVFLRLLDVPIPGMYGPSADDPKGF